jgi:hypothetical protein
MASANSNHLPVEIILKECFPVIYNKLLLVQQSLRNDFSSFVRNNYEQLEVLAKGAIKAAVYKRKEGYCYKTAYSDSSESEAESEQDAEQDFYIPPPRNALSTKKGREYCEENGITLDQLESNVELPLSVENVIQYLPDAFCLVRTNLGKKVSSSVDDKEERR